MKLQHHGRHKKAFANATNILLSRFVRSSLP